MSRLQGASGIHTGTMSFGKMEGEKSDKQIAYMIEQNSADGPMYHQEWEGMKPTTPIISGGMNALRMPGFFENLGHSNVIMTAGGGSYGHIDGAAEELAHYARPSNVGNKGQIQWNLLKKTSNLHVPLSRLRMMLISFIRDGESS